MRGTHTPQPRGPLTCSFRLVTLFPLAALLAYVAALSGCASVAANTDSRIAAKITVVPETVQFNEVVVGQENSQTLRVTNTSAEAVRLEALRITGKGFSVASGHSPLTLVPGHSALFTVAFIPASAAPVAGALEIEADLGTLSVPLEGSGEKAAPQLQASPSVLNFGTLPVHSAAAQTVTLKNDGNIAISISSIGLPSAAFSISGLSSGTTLSPGQTLQFRVTFQPPVAGVASSGITINSPSLSSPVKLNVSGSGSSSAGSSASGSTTTTSPATSPSVKLSWNGSASSVAGYHVYRGSASGGPYSRISSSTVTALGYEDATVQAGNRYYYVVSALDASGDESAYSNEAAADVPNQ
jgi:hypothetical protein